MIIATGAAHPSDMVNAAPEIQTVKGRAKRFGSLLWCSSLPQNRCTLLRDMLYNSDFRSLSLLLMSQP